MTTTTPQSAENGRPITLLGSLTAAEGRTTRRFWTRPAKSGPLTARAPSRASPPLGSPAADLTSTPATADNAVNADHHAAARRRRLASRHRRPEPALDGDGCRCYTDP